MSIVEKAGAYYIRSRYHHGWTSETRHYAVSNSIGSVSTLDRGIMFFFRHRPGQELAGAVYAINGHGEAVKVDDITVVDLTW